MGRRCGRTANTAAACPAYAYGEFFPSCATADGALTFVEYFSIDKETGLEKGVILVRLH